MPTRRIMIGFFARLLILYAVLAAPWPGVRQAYARGYRAVAGVAFYKFGPVGRVLFEPLSDSGRLMDTRIQIINTRTGKSNVSDHRAEYFGYLPTAELIALVLATPIPWLRRFKAMLLALVLLHALMACRMTILLLFGFSGDRPWCQFEPDPFWAALLVGANTIIVKSTSFNFVAPVLIWIPVTVRRTDLHRWFGITAPEKGATVAASGRANAAHRSHPRQ